MDRVGKYQLVRKLATGGMAEVFLARAEGPGGFSKKLVVKRILPHFLSDPHFANMFLSEARLAAELNHPNVVQIFDFGQADGQYYLAMEYIDGANLRVLNAAALEQGHRIPFPIAARLASHAAEGLHFAHELHGEDGKHIGLVHRDISPDNILLSRNGAVKVVDFGIAKASSQPSMTRSGVIKGKMAYMPPEQLGRKPIDRRIDVFALGVVLHELTTGTWPFDASSEVSIIQAIMNETPFIHVRERSSDIPEALDAIIAKCLEKNRELRYSTCKELQADLEKYISSTGQTVHPSDLADLVNKLVPAGVGSDLNVKAPTTGDVPIDKTVRRELTPGEELMMSDSTRDLPAVAPSQARGKAAKPKSIVPLIAMGITAGAVLSLAVAWLLRPSELPVLVDPPVATLIADAGVAEPEADAGAELAIAPVIVDAGLALVVAVDAGEGKPVAAAPRKLMIQFRIRPYARVFLDGKDIGETPLPPVAVTAGKHKIRMKNAKLGKDVEIEHVFQPGDSSFRYNFLE